MDRENTDIAVTNSTLSEFIKFFRDLFIVFIIAIFIKTFLFAPFRINGSSMENSYFNGEFILVDKLSYLRFDTHFDEFIEGSDGISQAFFWVLKKIPVHIWDPVRGDVVVVRPHVDKTREFYIKRVIGLPGDTIKFSSGSVFLKPKSGTGFIELNETYLSATNLGNTFLPSSVKESEFIIPEDMYWIMGDNRLNSADSRSCFTSSCSGNNATHFLPRSHVVGRVLLDFGYFNIFQENTLKLGSLSWIHPPRFFDTPRNHQYPELWAQ